VVGVWVTYNGLNYSNYIYSDNGTGYSLLQSYSFAYSTMMSFDGSFLLFITNVSGSLNINIVRNDGSSYSVFDTGLAFGSSVYYSFSKGLTNYIYVIPKNAYILRYEDNGSGFVLAEQISFATEGSFTSIAYNLTYLFRGSSNSTAK
jgi:hypothetical protein